MTTRDPEFDIMMKLIEYIGLCHEEIKRHRTFPEGERIGDVLTREARERKKE